MEYSEAEVGLAWRLHGCVTMGTECRGCRGPFDPFLVHSVTHFQLHKASAQRSKN